MRRRQTVLQFLNMHVLGIDAGGTKTICMLADGEGNVIGDARGGGANDQAAGELEVV
jgi:N-acetylglucosamine kinase-like BadF-type ATPase